MSKTCCYIGGSEDFSHLCRTAEELIVNEDVREFLITRSNIFDCLSASAIRSLKDRYHIRLTLIVPDVGEPSTELVKNIRKCYDDVIIIDATESDIWTQKFIKCHEEMIDRSDILLFSFAGVFEYSRRALEYARKQNKRVICLEQKQ